jgi:hypothetical protein
MDTVLTVLNVCPSKLPAGVGVGEEGEGEGEGEGAVILEMDQDKEVAHLNPGRFPLLLVFR